MVRNCTYGTALQLEGGLRARLHAGEAIELREHPTKRGSYFELWVWNTLRVRKIARFRSVEMARNVMDLLREQCDA